MQKLSYISIITIVILAISISIFDTDNLNWAYNSKSYVGFVLSIILIVIKYLSSRSFKKE